MAGSSPLVVQRAMKWVHGLGCITCDCYMQGLLYIFRWRMGCARRQRRVGLLLSPVLLTPTLPRLPL